MDFDFNKKRIIDLTNAVYRVTELFPKNEPLLWQIRETANSILADFILFEQSDLAKSKIDSKIKLILAYFSIAKSQKLVHLKNFLVLERDYNKISDYLASKKEKTGKESKELEKKEEIEPQNIYSEQKVINSVENNRNKEQRSLVKPIKDSFSSSPWSRQEKIVEMIKAEGEVSLEEIKSAFSQVSPRTLRRDLKSLAEKSVIYRNRKSKKDVLFGLKQKVDAI